MDPVLNYRKQIEQISQHGYFKSLEQEEVLKQQVRALHAENLSLLQAIGEIRSGQAAFDRLPLFEDRLFFIRQQEVIIKKNLEKQRQKTTLLRKKLLRASQKKKMLEQLKDRQNKAYQQFLNAKEAKILDEIAVLFHKR